MNWIDFIIIGLVVLSTLISLMRGFVREAISLVVWVAAFWIALAFGGALAATKLFHEGLTSPSLRIGIAFLSLFITTLIIGTLLNHLLATLVHKTGLSGTDRLLGVIFGAGRGVLVISAVLLVANYTILVKEHWWQQSTLIPQFKPAVQWLQGYLPEHGNVVDKLKKTAAQRNLMLVIPDKISYSDQQSID